MSFIQRVYFSNCCGKEGFFSLISTQVWVWVWWFRIWWFRGEINSPPPHHQLINHYYIRQHAARMLIPLGFELNRIIKRLLAIKPSPTSDLGLEPSRSYHGSRARWSSLALRPHRSSRLDLDGSPSKQPVVLKLRRRAARTNFFFCLCFISARKEPSGSPTCRRSHLRGYRWIKPQIFNSLQHSAGSFNADQRAVASSRLAPPRDAGTRISTRAAAAVNSK